ncbi:MAG: tetratricopeptide repeat-containing sulfotransferase family protein, partial [Planctomycetota bacterium]
NLQAKRDAAAQLYREGQGKMEIPDYKRAAISFYKSLENYACANTYYALAYCLKQLGNYAEGLHCYVEALKDSKYRTADHYFAAGLMARDAGLPAAALVYYSKSFVIAGGSTELFTCIGDAYLATGELDKAEDYLIDAFEAAEDGSRYKAAAKTSLAIIKEKRGDLQGAKTDLEELLVDHSDLAVMPYADVCHALSLQSLSIPLLLGRLEEVNEIDRRKIHFILGKQYDAIKEYGKAWQHYVAGNKLKKIIYRPEEYERSIAKTIRKYPHLPRVTSSEGKRAIFIVGMPRSGTTLIEQILSRHPDITAGGERVTVKDNVTARDYLKDLRSVAPAGRVTNKNPYNFLHLGKIYKMFPEAKIIHCTRDERDTSLSIFFQDFTGHHPYAYDLKNIEHYYKQYVKLMEHWDTISVPVLNINYENVVHDIEIQTRRLLEFIGLPWHSDCIEPHKSERIVNTASSQQVRKPIYTSSIERWRNYEEWV